jgi:hypothetical protein
MKEGKMRLTNQSIKVATNAVNSIIPKDDQTKMASSPLARILKNAGNGMPVCIKYIDAIPPLSSKKLFWTPRN